MNIKCFLGWHDWQIINTEVVRTLTGADFIYDKACLRCKKLKLDAYNRKEDIKQRRIDLIKRRKQAEEIMAKFLEKK